MEGIGVGSTSTLNGSALAARQQNQRCSPRHPLSLHSSASRAQDDNPSPPSSPSLLLSPPPSPPPWSGATVFVSCETALCNLSQLSTAVQCFTSES